MPHLEPRHRAVPRRKALRVLRRHARRRAVGAAEHDGAGDLAGRHVVVLGGGVDYLVNGLHGEVEGHELHHRAQALESGAHTDAREARLQCIFCGGWACVRVDAAQACPLLCGRRAACGQARPPLLASVMGVSRTRLGPYFCSRPRVILYAPWYSATSSPMMNTLSSRAISSSIAAETGRGGWLEARGESRAGGRAGGWLGYRCTGSEEGGS